MFPRARRENMVVEKLPEETLVCDVERNTAHSLRPLTALIWSRCDGATSLAELASAARRLGFEADEELVSLALDDLGRAELVTGWDDRRVSRRDLLRNVAALVGIETIAAPDIGEAGD